MHRSFDLSPSHYAASWVVPSDDNFNDCESINELGLRYAMLPDGPEKEAALLKLIEMFDPYLKKYTNMVIRGQLPNMKSAAGSDAAKMLRFLVPKGAPVDRVSLSKVCRTLHLAFKNQTIDDVYDVMVMCFLRACHRYDPGYVEKVQQVCEALDDKSVSKHFTAESVTPLVGFDATLILRLLVRKHYLDPIVGPKHKVIGYEKGNAWPPKPAFFESGPIGFTYYVQMWFRYFVQEYVSKAMAQIETKAGMLQLEHRFDNIQGGTNFAENGDCTSSAKNGAGLPHAFGNFVDANGISWAADTQLMDQQLDVSTMDDAWVLGSSDRFFRNMSIKERWLLQMVYRNESTWVDIAAMLECSTQTARQMYNDILFYMRGHLGVPEQLAA